MQSNVISLTVDRLNDGVAPVTETLNRHEETVNRTTYVVDGTHTLTTRDQVQLYRTYPKRSGASRGTARSSIKITNDISVDNADGSGEIVLPLIIECSFSVPVGTLPATTLALRQRLISLLDDDTVAAGLIDELNI
jgi:hypothetical protein